MDMLSNLQGWLKIIYVGFAFCLAFFLGALKGLLVCPVAGLILIIGNVGVIIGLFPAHVAWTVYTLVKTNRLDIPLKVAIFFPLPALFGLWLGLSIAGSVLVGVGYGFFTPWVSAFEAFRNDNECKKLFHCVVDGTWGTIKGSCTMVRDFADLCYHSYPIFLKEIRESPHSNELQPLRLFHVPGCIIAGLLGLVVDIPLYTVIAVIKSPYMLFKGWFRLLHDLISREGPFLETACIPIAGLTILLWPIVVIGSIVIAIFSSIFIGLYGSVVVYQERSFRRGVAYVIAMVAEFDEYTNDWLYLREGTILPKPRYRQKKVHSSSELPVGGNQVAGGKFTSASADAPAMLMPSLAHSRSVREAIQEVKMVQTLLYSIKAGSGGLLLPDSVEITHLNRPNNKLLDWFFNPIMVLKEQISVLKLTEPEVRYLEKVVLFGSTTERMEAWDNGGLLPEDALRAAQIQGISRRMIGLIRSVSKFPTYRRRFRQVVKALVSYSESRPETSRSDSIRSVFSIENV
ncbi:Membrane protein [Citrus sinensis]|nr:Membrane protein [Citrus sinensis]